MYYLKPTPIKTNLIIKHLNVSKYDIQYIRINYMDSGTVFLLPYFLYFIVHVGGKGERGVAGTPNRTIINKIKDVKAKRELGI